MRQSISFRHLHGFAVVALAFASLGICGCRFGVDDNKPPAVVASTSATDVKVGTVVQLDASRTTDPDKDPLNYTWTLQAPAGSKAVIANPRAPKTSFTADVPGTYAITIEVADGKKHNVKKTLAVKAVANKLLKETVTEQGGEPISFAWQFVEANASAERVATGSEVTLGSIADEPEAHALRTWTVLSKPAESVTEISDPAAPNPTIVLDAPGRYELQLEVSDDATRTTSEVTLEAVGAR